MSGYSRRDIAALADALDGLYAYDGGATDSGIHDPELRARCRVQIRSHPELIPVIAQQLYGAPPYTAADVEAFTKWVALDL